MKESRGDQRILAQSFFSFGSLGLRLSKSSLPWCLRTAMSSLLRLRPPGLLQWFTLFSAHPPVLSDRVPQSRHFCSNAMCPFYWPLPSPVPAHLPSTGHLLSPHPHSTYHIPAVLACLSPRPSEIPGRTDNAHLGLSIKSVHLVGPHRGLTACCPELLFPECVGSSLPGLPCPVGPISASPPSPPQAS